MLVVTGLVFEDSGDEDQAVSTGGGATLDFLERRVLPRPQAQLQATPEAR